MATLIEKIKAIKNNHGIFDTFEHREGYDSAIDDVIDIIESEPPYGEWLTDVELLKSLPDDSLILLKTDGSDHLPIIFIKDGQNLKHSFIADYGTLIQNILIGRSYQIIRPIPTTPEHEQA